MAAQWIICDLTYLHGCWDWMGWFKYFRKLLISKRYTEWGKKHPENGSSVGKSNSNSHFSTAVSWNISECPHQILRWIDDTVFLHSCCKSSTSVFSLFLTVQRCCFTHAKNPLNESYAMYRKWLASTFFCLLKQISWRLLQALCIVSNPLGYLDFGIFILLLSGKHNHAIKCSMSRWMEFLSNCHTPLK